jgi:hypothetical protein
VLLKYVSGVVVTLIAIRERGMVLMRRINDSSRLVHPSVLRN